MRTILRPLASIRISATADYFKMNNDISDGLVKAVIEVVIRED